ncbi:MAG: hypothetical protein ACT4UP_09220 [Gammaproteobacteria bacterium]
MQAATRVSVILLICATAAGCHTGPEFRNSWPQPVKLESGTCPDIDGVYENAGESGRRFVRHLQSMNSAISLAHLLNGQFDSFSYKNPDRLGATTSDPYQDAYRTIRVRHLVDTLHFEAVRADGRAASFELQASPECRDSWVLLKSGWAADTLDGPYPVQVRYDLAFSRFTDGALLVRTKTDFPTPGAGYTAVFFRDSHVYRFLPVRPAETQTGDR